MLEMLNKKISLPKGFKLPTMKFKKVNTITGGIVSIDPYTKKTYNFLNNTLSEGDLKFYDRKNFYISYIYMKDLTTGSVEITNAIGEEDLNDAIEVQAYDELGLDTAEEYTIKYIESNSSDSENRVFNIFAIPLNKISELFEDMENIKHIDYITPAPLLFSALYKKEYLSRGKVDSFIYLDYNDAHISIYQDGEYLFSKTLTFSLKKINEEFAKSLGQHIDEKEFFNLLKVQGLKTTDSTVQKSLIKIFGEMLNYVKDVLQFAKRSNSLESIDNIYITSKIGDIKGLPEFANSYTDIDCSKLEIKVSKNSSEIEIDPICEIMTIFAREYQNSSDDTLNISMFKKEPPFFTRPSGKLTKTVAAAMIVSLAYPLYQVGQTYLLEKEYKLLNNHHNTLSINVSSMKTSMAEVVKQNKEVDEKLKVKDKELAFRTKLLYQIYSKKVSYPMKAKVLNDLFKKVNKHRSKITRFENHDRELILSVRSSKDKYITELIKELSKNKNYKVSTDVIIKDKKKSYYQSAIKVELYGNN